MKKQEIQKIDIRAHWASYFFWSIIWLPLVVWTFFLAINNEGGDSWQALVLILIFYLGFIFMIQRIYLKYEDGFIKYRGYAGKTKVIKLSDIEAAWYSIEVNFQYGPTRKLIIKPKRNVLMDYFWINPTPFGDKEIAKIIEILPMIEEPEKNESGFRP